MDSKYIWRLVFHLTDFLSILIILSRNNIFFLEQENEKLQHLFEFNPRRIKNLGPELYVSTTDKVGNLSLIFASSLINRNVEFEVCQIYHVCTIWAAHFVSFVSYWWFFLLFYIVVAELRIFLAHNFIEDISTIIVHCLLIF